MPRAQPAICITVCFYRHIELLSPTADISTPGQAAKILVHLSPPPWPPTLRLAPSFFYPASSGSPFAPLFAPRRTFARRQFLGQTGTYQVPGCKDLACDTKGTDFTVPNERLFTDRQFDASNACLRPQENTLP
ncbi:hypothetical protein KM043_015282 [Ampulex compressa]|nr:hypothetical protein KM043_015282 [Ampulex compressa]